jgi:monofunctional biosynthetic peptidoglycan transglycosylase
MIVFLMALPFVVEASENTIENERVLFDFQKSGNLNNWRIVNDGVMGGLSQSEFTLTSSNTAIFKGTVSLENNGGFSSVRTIPRSYKLQDYRGIIIRCKGDGKNYQFRIWTNDRFDGMSYMYRYKSVREKWIIIRVPFDECIPVFRGRILDNVNPINPKEIQQIGFLIADKQPGRFKLEIDWIKAYKN